MDDLARHVYRDGVMELFERFNSEGKLYKGVTGYDAARDALKIALRDPTAEDLFLSAANKFLRIVQGSRAGYVAVAPVQFGGEFVGHLLYQFAGALRERNLHNKEVGFHPIRKLIGRRFVLDVPRREHVFVVVDDVKGSGNTFRQIRSKHPSPGAVHLIYLAEPGKTDKYRAAKMLAALSYVKRALDEKNPEYLREMVEKRMNPHQQVEDNMSDRRSWRALDL